MMNINELFRQLLSEVGRIGQDALRIATSPTSHPASAVEPTSTTTTALPPSATTVSPAVSLTLMTIFETVMLPDVWRAETMQPEHDTPQSGDTTDGSLRADSTRSPDSPKSSADVRGSRDGASNDKALRGHLRSRHRSHQPATPSAHRPHPAPTRPTAPGPAPAAKEADTTTQETRPGSDAPAARPTEGETSAVRFDVAESDKPSDSTPSQKAQQDVTSGNHGEPGISVKTRSGAGGQLITLQLSPPNLGPMTVVLSFSDAGLQAQIVAENDDTVAAVNDSLPQLRRSLIEFWDVTTIRVAQREPSVEPRPPEENYHTFDQRM